MIILQLSLLLLLNILSVSSADTCTCVDVPTQIDPIAMPFIVIQNPTIGGSTSGAACSMNCTYTIDSNDSSNGLQVQLLSNAMTDDAKIVITGAATQKTMNKLTPIGDQGWKSTGQTLTFEFTEGDSSKSLFMFIVSKADGFDDAPTIPPPTTPLTTPLYQGPLKHNPLLVSNDIMIGIDLSNNAANFEKLRGFAIDLVNQLSFSANTECNAGGSRITIHALSALGFDSTYYINWQSDNEIALKSLNSIVPFADGGNYSIGSIKGKLDSGYGLVEGPENKSTTDEPFCPNRGRIYLLLTSNTPSEADDSDFTNPDFFGHGVHPILVSYDMKDSTYYDTFGGTDANKVMSHYKYMDDGNDINSFIDKYLVDSSDELNCQNKKNETTITLSDTDNKKTVLIPPYYAGKHDVSTNWDTINHYCNFQVTTFSIAEKDIGTIDNVCLTVYYDLETGKDFVSIYGKDGSEVVRLTGRDVSGTQFELGSATGTIVFSSDEKNVYDGVHIDIEAGSCS